MIVPVIRRIEEKKKTLLPRIYPGECKPAVKVGQSVSEADVIAHCEISAGRRIIKISGALGIAGGDAHKFLLRKEGDRIYEGEVIAKKSSLFGIKNTEVKSPIDGQIVHIDDRGDLMVKFNPRPVRFIAAARGKIQEIAEDRIIISTVATIVRGAVSIGKEREGVITMVAGPKEFIIPGMIKTEYKGKILVGGSLLEKAALEKAVTLGISGIITGGMNKKDFDSLGVSGEALLTLLITEGFGNLPMGSDILEFLKKKEGYQALISSEEKSLIIPETSATLAAQETGTTWRQLQVGDKVRFFKDEGGELIGEVKEIIEDQILNSGILACVAKVKFGSQELPVPAVNLEIIET